MRTYAGVDLGATNLRAAVADAEGSILGEARRSTPRGPDGRAVTDAVVATLEGACRDAGVGPAELSAVGVASIGPLDRTAGAVVDPPNLPDGVERVDLTAPVAELVGSGRVSLHNDAVAGVLGERQFGDAPDNAVYLTISSGVGAGACVDGHVLAGRNGNAAEMGHLTVDPGGLMPCGCGGAGHWEAYCGGRNLPAYAARLRETEGLETSLPLQDGDIDAADVFAAAGDDPLADVVVERVARWNALGVAALVHAYDPAVVAVGGAVALENERLVVDPIRERVEAHLAVPAPTIRPTTLGESAVVRGAIAGAMTGGDRE